MEAQYPQLAKAALDARAAAYAPYSQFYVGAAALAEDGRVFTGCNVENASYGMAICAERVAIGKGVSEGVRRFKAIAIAGAPAAQKAPGPSGFEPCPPCGACRQVMYEFGGPGLKVLLVQSPLLWDTMLLSDLLPQAFGPESL